MTVLILCAIIPEMAFILSITNLIVVLNMPRSIGDIGYFYARLILAVLWTNALVFMAIFVFFKLVQHSA